MPHTVRKIGSPEVTAHDVLLGEFQMELDVLGHALRCGSSQCQDGHPGQFLAQLGDAQIGGPKVVAPLRDAMGLVDSDQRDIHPHDPQAERLGGEPFGRHIEELHVAVDAIVQCNVQLPRRKARMNGDGRNAERPQTIDLIFHQGDERRHDDAQPLAGHCRHLIGQRLAAARRHQSQRIATVQHGADNPLLHGTELRIPPIPPEDVRYVDGLLHGYKGTHSAWAAKKSEPKSSDFTDISLFLQRRTVFR